MNEAQILVAHAVKLGLLAVLGGILLRGRLRLCWVFPLYAAAVLAGNSLVTLWPARFYNASFWMLKQGVYDVLKMALALELAWRTLGEFPGAWRTARVVLLALLGLSTAALFLLTPRSSYRTLWEWQPSVATAAVWLLTATALLVVWYQVPIHDFQRAIMLGLAPYLLVFVTLLDLLRRHGWKVRAEVGLADSLAYMGVVFFWGVGGVAEEPGVTAEIILASAGCAALCYTLGRHNRALTLQRWHFVLNAPEREAIESLRQKMQLDSALARQALDAAERARGANRIPDALTVLGVALSILEDAGADRLTRLRAMGVYSRMVRAIQPLPPPGPGSFRGPGLRATASLAGIAHRFLVGTQERFRLWLLFLGLGVRIVLRGGRRSAGEASQQPHRGRPWDLFARDLGDFEALDASHLSAFEALAASLAAVDRGGRLRLWDRIAGDAR